MKREDLEKRLGQLSYEMARLRKQMQILNDTIVPLQQEAREIATKIDILENLDAEKQ